MSFQNSNHPASYTKLSQNFEIDIPPKSKPLQWTYTVPKSDQKPNPGPLTCHIQLVRSQDRNQKPNPGPLTCHIQLVRSQCQKTKNQIHIPDVIFKTLPRDGT